MHLRESNIEIRIACGNQDAPVQTLVRTLIFLEAENAPIPVRVTPGSDMNVGRIGLRLPTVIAFCR